MQKNLLSYNYLQKVRVQIALKNFYRLGVTRGITQQGQQQVFGEGRMIFGIHIREDLETNCWIFEIMLETMEFYHPTLIFQKQLWLHSLVGTTLWSFQTSQVSLSISTVVSTEI